MGEGAEVESTLIKVKRLATTIALVGAVARCMDCQDFFPMDGSAHKYGKQWKCRKCHSAYRWLRDNDSEWSSRTTKERQELIVANREHGGRGSARTMQTVHKAGCI